MTLARRLHLWASSSHEADWRADYDRVVAVWNPPLSLNAWLRWEVVSPRLPENARDVLEIGCGLGGFGARLADRYRYVGLEPDARSAAVAAARLAATAGSAEVRNGDLAALTVDETFDFVCAFEVLEHIEDDTAAVESWRDRISPGGSLMLSVPAWRHRFAAADSMVGHFRRYDPADLSALLVKAGFVDVNVLRYGAPAGFALEALRNALGRRLRSRLTNDSIEERTARSGRLVQPRTGVTGAAMYLVMVPMRKLQHVFPDAGPGLLATARRPAQPGSRTSSST
jgi:SAM-dependent methyltransferase